MAILPTVKSGMEPTIVQARNGVEALNALPSTPIDAVIAAFQMPQMNGLELLKALRVGKTKAVRGLPFAMLPGHTDQDLVGAALALDVNAFLAKPVAKATMANRLGRMFSDEFTPKDIGEYDQVVVPGQYGKLQDGPESGPSELRPTVPGVVVPRPPPVVHRPSIRRPLDEVSVNAVLAREIRAPNGQALLGVGQVLTNRQLNRLRELREMGMPVDDVWVYT